MNSTKVCIAILAALLAIPGTVGASDYVCGRNVVFTQPDRGNANILIAQPMTCDKAGHLITLSFYSSVAGAQLYLAEYADSNGSPGALVAKTAAFTTVAGWNTRPVLVPVDQPAGTYWLAHLSSSTVALGVWQAFSNGSTYRFYSRSFSSGIPQSFSTSSTVGDTAQWSHYATLAVEAAVKPSAPGTPAILMAKYGSITFAWDYSDSVDEFRLYSGIGASGCPGGQYTAFQSSPGNVSRLVWGLDHTAQVTAVLGSRESDCSNVVTGQPK